jgi:homoserine O-succinyltransferase
LLLQKCSGVFAQVVDEDHALADGASRSALPHSRFNEVPLPALEAAGYQVVSRSVDGPWTVAVAERGLCQFVLLQGHPEYQPLTLLREYRRDVRNYLLGSQGSYPHMPTGYLSAEGMDALSRFQAEVSGRPRDPARMAHFPFDLAAQHVRVDWDQPARALMGNWLRSVRQRAGLPAYSEAGA